LARGATSRSTSPALFFRSLISPCLAGFAF
jgi:hypothetical protein